MTDKTINAGFEELSILEIGKLTCALSIKDIQEINKHLEISRVANAPKFIRGISNLRGSIITVIDMRIKFGMEPKEFDSDTRIVVIKNQDEQIGLLVDKMLDVQIADSDNFEPTPSNVSGVAGRFFSSIYKMDNKLAAILNTEEILSGQE